MASGKLFQTFGAVTGNALLPTLCNPTDGTRQAVGASRDFSKISTM